MPYSICRAKKLHFWNLSILVKMAILAKNDQKYPKMTKNDQKMTTFDTFWPFLRILKISHFPKNPEICLPIYRAFRSQKYQKWQKSLKIVKNHQKNHEKSIKNEILGWFWRFLPFCPCADPDSDQKMPEFGYLVEQSKMEKFWILADFTKFKVLPKMWKNGNFYPFLAQKHEKMTILASSRGNFRPPNKPIWSQKAKTSKLRIFNSGQFWSKLMKNH